MTLTPPLFPRPGMGWNRPVWTHDGRSLMVPTLPPDMDVLQAARLELGESESPQPVQDVRQLPVQIYQTGQASPSTESQPRRFVSELTQIPLSGGQPRRFRAAIARNGLSNLVNDHLRFDKGKASCLACTETGQGNMHCTLWKNPGRYLENSPVFALDQVQTPLLLVHGQNDNAAWVEETGQVFVGLQRLGKKATYLAYPGEGHWEGTWTRQHQLDYCNRMLDFLIHCQVTPGPR